MLLPPLPSILPLLLLTLPTQTHSTPSPPILYESEIHLMPRNVLFYRRQAADLQTFKSNLGGVSASPITNSGDAKRPFSVDGDTFTDFATAAQRSCDKQANACSKAANDGGNKGGLKVSDCDQQKSQCNDAQKAATVTSFGNNNGNNNNGGNNNNNNNGGGNNNNNNNGGNNNNNNGGNAAAQSPAAIASTNIGPDPLFPDFDLICDA